jgi:hypothetical protein
MSNFDSSAHPRNHPTGKSRFSDKLQSTSDISVDAGLQPPIPFSGPFDIDLSEQEQELADGLALLFASSEEGEPWMAGGLYSCDGGAVAAKLMADRLGIPATLEVGLYWHSDVELRADLIGEYPGADDSDADWAEALDRVSTCMDEHHHWVVLNPGTSQELLVDPNGPERREPYFVRTEDAAGLDERYSPQPIHIIFDPNEGAESIATWCYPGLSERIRAL